MIPYKHVPTPNLIKILGCVSSALPWTGKDSTGPDFTPERPDFTSGKTQQGVSVDKTRQTVNAR